MPICTDYKQGWPNFILSSDLDLKLDWWFRVSNSTIVCVTDFCLERLELGHASHRVDIVGASVTWRKQLVGICHSHYFLLTSITLSSIRVLPISQILNMLFYRLLLDIFMMAAVILLTVVTFYLGHWYQF